MSTPNTKPRLDAPDDDTATLQPFTFNDPQGGWNKSVFADDDSKVTQDGADEDREVCNG